MRTKKYPSDTSREQFESIKSLFTIFLDSADNKQLKRKKYASDISREKFAEIEPLLRSVRSAAGGSRRGA